MKSAKFLSGGSGYNRANLSQQITIGERMEAKKLILREEILRYIGPSPSDSLFAACDDDAGTYTLISIEAPPARPDAMLVIAARVIGEHIIIEHDITESPLLDALLEAGISRDTIILTYAGENRPDTAKPSMQQPLI